MKTHKIIYEDGRLDYAQDRVHNTKDMVKFFGEDAKLLYSRLTFAFWEVELGVFCKVHYRLKSGDFHIEGETANPLTREEINYKVFDIDYFYK